MRSSDSRRLYFPDVLSTGIVALLALMHLPYPFGGDQTLFTLYGIKMNQGAWLYRDLWDVKQPGIYAFYFAAGKLFGFTEVGVHLLELLCWVGFSAALILKCRTYFRFRWIASLAPLLTAGFYYGVAGSNHLTKLEPLVGIPIFFSLCWACDASTSDDHAGGLFFLSGLMGGIVLLFKLVLLPIPLTFWLCAPVFAARRKKTKLAIEFLNSAWPVLIGVFLPLLAVVGWFALRHNLNPLLYAWFIYPLKVAAELPKMDRSGTLLNSLQWFFGNFASLLMLGFIGAWAALSRRRDVMTITLVLWVVAASFVILIQKYSWWEYHYFLLLIPLGILAGKGIEQIWEFGRAAKGSPEGFALDDRRRRLVFALALAFLFSPILDSWAMLGLRLARHSFAITTENRLKFQEGVNPFYASVAEDVTFLSQPGAAQGDIFIFGDPRYYYLSGRNQAIAQNGANPDIMLPGQWREMETQLAQARPPYVYVATDQVEIQRAHAPALLQFLGQNYQALRTRESGTWYVRRDLASLVRPGEGK